MDLSIIILNYNTKELTKKVIESLKKCLENEENKNINYEIILVDNASTDGSKDFFEEYATENSKTSYIYNKSNLGFGKANNIGIQKAKGKYILLLNSDVIVTDVNFSKIINYFEKDEKIGVLTVKVMLSDKNIDPASHRGFPTPWRSFCYFSKLEKITQKIPGVNKYFGGYHLTYKDLNHTHEIDSPTGAFYFTRNSIMEAIQGFDETYFMYGEDLDMSLRIKKLGFKIIYFPYYQVLHLKNQSGLKSDFEKTAKKTNIAFYEAMKIFYKKHYSKEYPDFFNKLIYFFIDLKSKH